MNRSYNKVFCIGLNKTGTSSLHKAFLLLGLKSVHFKDDKKRNIKSIIAENYSNGQDILKGISHYDAFSDWDRVATGNCFVEFDKQYPNSKFILNTRDINEWLKSREMHVRRNRLKKKKDPNADVTWLTIDKRGWKKQYHERHANIKEYFKERQNDLLIFDVTKGDDWTKLCPFLEMDIPTIPFPKSHIQRTKKRTAFFGFWTK